MEKSTDKNEYQIMGNTITRELYCSKCKGYIMSSERAPRCSCGENLITVVYSVMTGERITGR